MNSESEVKNQGGSNQDGKRLFKFSFNVNKKTDDQTEMTGEFVGDVQHFCDYDEAVAKCFQLLEACYIPVGGKPSKDDEDSFQKMATALHDFKTHFQNTPHSQALDTFDSNMKAACAARKAHQKDQKYQLRHLRRFHVDDFQKFLTQRKAFDESRKRMDQAKVDVRDAKTTAQIEKKAICYQMAVDDFDAQTELLIKLIDGLPKIKQTNCHDILMFLTKHKVYHADMVRFYKIT
ncbi:unnamed protein product [Caenorhabditis angaria]|uniref:BAR domain-containing protein n=1 Tax=Caenorhabditis angaria TaxID=860376 RepID=A0A9P1IDA7_9PELO|nr:unnamed protein product [Caenorhabditis angaria]